MMGRRGKAFARPSWHRRVSSLTLTMLLCLLVLDGSCAFSQATLLRRRNSPLSLKSNLNDSDGTAQKLRPGSMAAATAEQGSVPYGESSRKYRRTVYDHDDWVQHRTGFRIKENIFSMFLSGVVRQLQQEVFFVTAVAVVVVLWNGYLNAPFTLNLPGLPFTLSSPALGLLLVFRTNTSYGRWMEARSRWATVNTHCINIVRMVATFVDASTPSGRDALRRLALAAWMFPRSMMNRLLGAEDAAEFETEINTACGGSDFAEYLLLDAPDRPLAALMELSVALDAMPIDEKPRLEVDKSVIVLGDCLSACDRIFTSPVPLVYTRHTARFLSLWMLLIPLPLYDVFARSSEGSANVLESLLLIPAAAILSIFLFGIQELSVQLEEPFSILPLQKFCDDIKQSNEILQERAIAYSVTQETKATS